MRQLPHCIHRQETNECWRSPRFLSLLSPGLQPTDFKAVLLSYKVFWENLHRHAQRCFHDDSKNQVENHDEPSQILKPPLLPLPQFPEKHLAPRCCTHSELNVGRERYYYSWLRYLRHKGNRCSKMKMWLLLLGERHFHDQGNFSSNRKEGAHTGGMVFMD